MRRHLKPLREKRKKSQVLQPINRIIAVIALISGFGLLSVVLSSSLISQTAAGIEPTSSRVQDDLAFKTRLSPW